MAGSNRRGDSRCEGVDVVDPMTAQLNLSAPFSPLLARWPTVPDDGVAQGGAGAGEKFGANRWLGTFQVRRARRAGQIVLERYPGYWKQGQIFLEKVIYLPIVDATVRLAQSEVRPA